MTKSLPHLMAKISAASVLVVDDDELQRSALARMLRRSGVETLHAANYDEAIAILAKQSDFFAVISELEMAGKDGLELLDEVRRRIPSARRVLISGSFPEGTSEQAFASGVAHACVLKPYTMDEIVTAIKGGVPDETGEPSNRGTSVAPTSNRNVE
jgi:CheY-like chemotaxis protein